MAPEEHPPRSDHMPILTVLRMPPTIQLEAPRPNYRLADWEEVREELAIKLNELDAWEEINTLDEFSQHLDGLMQVILQQDSQSQTLPLPKALVDQGAGREAD